MVTQQKTLHTRIRRIDGSTRTGPAYNIHPEWKAKIVNKDLRLRKPRLLNY